jgi:ribosomal-protein-alanine N-acetyltransferase
MIGERELWGIGLGTKSVDLILKYAKKKLKLNKVISSIMSVNKASKKVLTKNKFKEYGEIKNFYYFQNKHVSKIFFIKYLK